MIYKEIDTTAYHPQCDSMVEHFNRTLKTMLRKHASPFGNHEIATFLEFCLLTETLPKIQLVKNHRILF